MPHADQVIEGYLRRHKLPESAVEYIHRASLGLSRNVGTSGYRSVVVEYPSRKMGTSIVTESRRGELAYAISCEFDDDVIAYFEQPPAIDVCRTDARGRRRTQAYHPDFLVLHVKGPFVVEIKPQDKLARKASRSPTDWTFDGERFRDAPAERALEEIGLRHVVVSIDSMPAMRIANYRTLLQTRHAVDDGTAEVSSADLEATFRERAVGTLASVAASISLTSYSPLFRLIDRRVLHCDLDRQLLTDVTSCLVTPVPELLDEVFAQREVGAAPVSIAKCPPKTQAQQAIENLQSLGAGTMPARTARRHRAAIRKALSEGRTTFEAVTPQTFNSGNTNRKRADNVIEHAIAYIRSKYGSPMRPSAGATYSMYRADAASCSPPIKPLCKKSFKRHVKRLERDLAFARGGKRQENAFAAPSDVDLRVQTPQRPFELATCDHFLADIELVVLRDQKKTYTAKPWITVLKDVATKVVLGAWIALRAPSRIACAMVLRSCVRNHGRLPEAIVVDRGSDFQSVYFASLLASYGVAHVSRPSSDPRYGAEAERHYGEFKSFWLPHRQGNSADPIGTRSISGTHSAASTAELGLESFLNEYLQFCQWQRTTISPNAMDSRGLLFAEGMARFPDSGITVTFDEAFIVATAVDDTRIKLDPARGLHVGNSYYWHSVLASDRLRQSQIEVRREPEDCSIVHARVDREWITCKSSSHALLGSHSYAARVANSLSLTEAGALRQQAIDDSNRKLVQAIHASDVALASAKTSSRTKPSRSDTWDDDDQIEVPRMSSWETSRD